MKCYRLRLSSVDEVCTINQRMADGRGASVSTRVRNIELEILYACFNQYAKQVDYLGEYLQCIRYMKIIQEINDGIEFLTLVKSDMENLIKGFILTKHQRPDTWPLALNLLTQIESPEEVEIQ